jgi:hypothetical protein
MRVVALTSFASEDGKHEAGDEFEMADELALVRIKGGLVRGVGSEPETATLPAAETAVARRRRK